MYFWSLIVSYGTVVTLGCSKEWDRNTGARKEQQASRVWSWLYKPSLFIFFVYSFNEMFKFPHTLQINSTGWTLRSLTELQSVRNTARLFKNIRSWLVLIRVIFRIAFTTTCSEVMKWKTRKYHFSRKIWFFCHVGLRLMWWGITNSIPLLQYNL